MTVFNPLSVNHDYLTDYTLFMQLYMTKTKELANQVLSMLFGGGYTILDFIINSNEFRIPFVGEGLPVDDISSGSASQIAMMGMIINLVLLNFYVQVV